MHADRCAKLQHFTWSALDKCHLLPAGDLREGIIRSPHLMYCAHAFAPGIEAITTGMQGNLEDILNAYLRGEISGATGCEHHH